MDIIGSSWTDNPTRLFLRNEPDLLELQLKLDLAARLDAAGMAIITNGTIGETRFDGDLLVSCHVDIGSFELVAVFNACILDDEERRDLWGYEPWQCNAVLLVVDGNAVCRRERLPLTLAHWSTLIDLINKCGTRHEAAQAAIDIADRPYGKLARRL